LNAALADMVGVVVFLATAIRSDYVWWEFGRHRGPGVRGWHYAGSERHDSRRNGLLRNVCRGEPSRCVRQRTDPNPVHVYRCTHLIACRFKAKRGDACRDVEHN